MNTKTLFAAVLFAAACAAPARADKAFDEVFACMHASVPATLRVQEFELTSTDRQNAERVLKGRLFAERRNGNLRVTMKLDAPVSVKGAAVRFSVDDPQARLRVKIALWSDAVTIRIIG